MKKTTILFAVLLLAILALCIPAPDAEAAGHYHNGNTAVEYTAWTDTASLPATEGRYCLTKDVKLT